MELFDPVKIVTFISLAATAIWAICYMRDARRGAQRFTLIVILVAMGLAFVLELSHHIDPCEHSAKLLINEFCAEGQQCAGGKDFVEIINPSGEPVDLGCYALADSRSTRSDDRMPGNPFLLPRGQVLEPGEIRAWDEGETRFQLSWRQTDRLQLVRVKLLPGQLLDFAPLDGISIDSQHSYGFRTTNTAEPWKYLIHDKAKDRSELGTFGQPNDT